MTVSIPKPNWRAIQVASESPRTRRPGDDAATGRRRESSRKRREWSAVMSECASVAASRANAGRIASASGWIRAGPAATTPAATTPAATTSRDRPTGRPTAVAQPLGRVHGQYGLGAFGDACVVCLVAVGWLFAHGTRGGGLAGRADRGRRSPACRSASWSCALFGYEDPD